MSGSMFRSWFRKPSNKFPPFALRCGFWLTTVPIDQAAGHPGFTLQTVTSFHRPGLHHYYGFICHLTPRRSTSDCPLCLPYPIPDHSGIETMQGFPNYLGFPVDDPILNHATGLTTYRASRYVQFTSYRFLQTLPFPATPLRFGLTSLWSGRRLFLSTGRGCPLRWANQKWATR